MSTLTKNVMGLQQLEAVALYARVYSAKHVQGIAWTLCLAALTIHKGWWLSNMCPTDQGRGMIVNYFVV